MMSELIIPQHWVSIDPGDRFVGWCRWQGTRVVEAAELSPEECVAQLEMWTCLFSVQELMFPPPHKISVCVFERFALYAWNEKSLAGNEFKTPQLIGTIKYICRRAGVETVGQFASQGKSTYKRAPFKHWSTRDWRKALGGSNIGRGHSRDALAHGYEFLRGRGYVPQTA